MHRRLAAPLAALIALTAGLAAVTWGQSGEYKIGVLEPLTGPLAGEGKRHLEGYEIVRDMINERGGVMGKKLVFVAADRKSTRLNSSHGYISYAVFCLKKKKKKYNKTLAV